jgi:hypothetical protein
MIPANLMAAVVPPSKLAVCWGWSLCLPDTSAALAQRAREIALRIAKGNAVFAVRRTTVGLAIDAFVNHDHFVAGSAKHLDGPVHYDAATAVERQQIGRTIALTGNN